MTRYRFITADGQMFESERTPGAGRWLGVAMTRYRFITADGQMFESERTPAQIHKTYPDARITHVVEADSVGNPTFAPYVDQSTVTLPNATETQKEAPPAREKSAKDK